MSKTQLVDGLWKRTTHYGKHRIDITVYRTPYSWNAIAESDCGKVECGGQDAFSATKSALKNLRMNIPIWSYNRSNLKCYTSYI
jgi:hypothetical protein